jgi:putative FmdB family regulatory protein
MPIYEYKCDRCEDVFEVIQKFVDPPVTVHEDCGGNVVRLISTSALQFKGSGFYITDYKKSGGNGAKSANAKSGESSSSSSSSKSESSSSTPAATATPAATSTPAASTSSESKK